MSTVHRVEFERALANFVNQNKLKCSEGPKGAKDSQGNAYTTLIQGIPKEEGGPIQVRWAAPCPEMYRHFFGELQRWLKKRKILVFRDDPEIGTYKDGYFIYCRLTAY